MTEDAALPGKLDCETRAQLSRALRPILDTATDWASLGTLLKARGYVIAFRRGRLLVVDTFTGQALCTGSDVDRPLASLARRFGRPRLRAAPDGITAAFA